MRALSVSSVALVATLGASSWFLFHGAKHPARPKAHATYTEAPIPVTPPPSPVARVAASPTARPTLPTPSASSASPKAVTSNSVEEAPYVALFAADAPPVAESWKYQNAIREELDKLPRSSVSVESLDCRSRLCKAQLLFDNVQSDMRVLKEVFLTGSTADYPHGFGSLAVPTREHLPDGRVRITLYLAREGEMLAAGAEADTAEP